MRVRGLIAVISVASQVGCGTVLQGKTQRVSISTIPPGAEISVDGQRATAPASIDVPRKSFTVIRASAPGYYDACKVVRAPIRGGFLTMDIVFLLVPLAIDAAGGMDQLRRLPGEIEIPMVKAGTAQPPELPTDAELVARFQEGPDPCAPSATAGSRELVMTTGDVSVPYSILGSVRVQEKGREAARPSRPIFSFRSSGLPALEPEHQHVVELLRDQALVQYGDQVDALINVSYRGDARSGDVSAEGLAVKFIDRPTN